MSDEAAAHGRSEPAEGVEEGTEEPPVLRVKVKHRRWPYTEEIVEAESHEALGHWDPTAWHAAG